jgi:hypothetical protein
VTPLVLIAFNRPDLLRQQLEIVRHHHKGSIYCVVDGPRTGKVGEAEKVAEVIQLLKGLQPQFEVAFNCAESNMGCYQRIKSGLDWVFSKVDRAIILEDDCIPSPQFFTFADKMLEHFKDDQRVFSISGTNLFPELSPPNQSYFFSRYHNCWGWATWARAWQFFIDNQAEWLEIRHSAAFRGTFLNLRSFLYWRMIFDKVYAGKINSWAYRWMLSCWMQSGLSVHAKVNLITNVGDGVDATRTAGARLTRRLLGKLDEALPEPRHLLAARAHDSEFEDVVFSKSVWNRVRWLGSRVLRMLAKS